VPKSGRHNESDEQDSDDWDKTPDKEYEMVTLECKREMLQRINWLGFLNVVPYLNLFKFFTFLG
jgi:hypothetical protein